MDLLIKSLNEPGNQIKPSSGRVFSFILNLKKRDETSSAHPRVFTRESDSPDRQRKKIILVSLVDEDLLAALGAPIAHEVIH